MLPENQHQPPQVMIGEGSPRAKKSSRGRARQLLRWRPRSIWQVVLVVVLLAGLGTTLAIVSHAANQYVITSPVSGTTVSNDFAVNTEFRAAANTAAFNVVVTLDGRTILAKVASAINNGEQRPYIFSGGVNGINKFPVDNLSPGQHTIRAYARAGTVIGQGALLSSSDAGFTAQPKNIRVTGESPKELNSSDLTFDASQKAPRTALAPHPDLLQRFASVAGTARGSVGSLQQLVLPKAVAHSCNGCRHGDIDVIAVTSSGEAVPGVIFQVGHAGGVLDGCHNGNIQTTHGPGGDANFRTCAVSSQGGTQATYNVTATGIPAGYSLADTQTKQMIVEWNTNKDIHFTVNHSAAATPPEAHAPGGNTTTPPPNTNCTSGSIVIGEGASNQTICNNSTGPIVIGTGASGVTTVQTPYGNQTVNLNQPATSSGQPAAVYNYDPGDGPLLAITKLAATSATVNIFGYKTINNLPVDNVQSVTVTIDTVLKGARSDFSINPAHANTTLSFGDVNLADGQPHTLVFKATNDNGASNSVTLTIKPTGAPNNPTTSQPSTGNAIPGAPTTVPSTPQLCDTNKSTAGVASPANGTGTIVVCSYDVTGGVKALIGNVEVHTQSIGVADTDQLQCNPRNKTTSPNPGDSSKGRATFINCPVSQNSSIKQKEYSVSFVKLAGYRESETSPHKAGCDNSKYHFNVERNKVTRIEIYLIRGSGNVTCEPAPTSPNPSGNGSTANPNSTPSPHKAGQITIETWVDNRDGGTMQDKALSGVSVKMVSTGRSQDECLPAAGSTTGSPANVAFRSCPVAFAANGDNYAKQWEIHAQIPPGYQISSQYASLPSTNAKQISKKEGDKYVAKVQRIVDLQKEKPETFTVVLQKQSANTQFAQAASCVSGGASPGSAAAAGCALGTPKNPITATPTGSGSGGVCAEIKAVLPGLNQAQSQRYTDYLCGAAGRYSVNAALQLAIIAQESMGGQLLTDPVAKQWTCGTFCGPGQFSKSTWDAVKRDGVNFGGRTDGGGDGVASAWNSQKWSDAVYTGAYYVAKYTNISRTSPSEADVRQAYCKYKRPGNSCKPSTDGYNTSGTDQVVSYWKQYKATLSTVPTTPGAGTGTTSPLPSTGGSFGSCPRLATTNIDSVTGTRAEIEARLLKYATTTCGNKLQLQQGTADRTKNDIRDASKSKTDLLKLMIVLIENGGYNVPVWIINTGHGCPSEHCLGTAVDIGYASNTATGKDMYRYLYSNRSSLKLNELIYAPPPSGTNCMDNGKAISGGAAACQTYFDDAYTEHNGHIHASVRN